MEIHFKKDCIKLASLKSSDASFPYLGARRRQQQQSSLVNMSLALHILPPQHQFELLQAQCDGRLSAAVGV